MATRKATDERKRQMLSELRALCSERSVGGGTVPPLRDLAKKFQVSLAVAHSVLKILRDEGIVESFPGRGTTIVTKKFVEREVYIYLESGGPGYNFSLNEDPVFIGMTDQFADWGSYTLGLQDWSQVVPLLENPNIKIRGLYGKSLNPITGEQLLPDLPFPVVSFHQYCDKERSNRILWDDLTGGREATHHLLQTGQRKITFVGSIEGPMLWSQLRAEGYREAMLEAGYGNFINVIGWDQEGEDNMVRFARIATRKMVAENLPEAIVACNDLVATTILETLRELAVPLEDWPGIIGFDALGMFANQPISSMRLDRRELGRVAAEILWEHSHRDPLLGRLPLVSKALPMRLVPRMTSHKGWALEMQYVTQFSESPATTAG